MKFAVNSELLGDGPLLGGRQYPSYFTPPEGTLVKAFGQVGDEENLVDVVDAWGQPLAAASTATNGVLPNNRSGNDGNPETWQFRPEGATHILNGLSGLGEHRKQRNFLQQQRNMHFVARKTCRFLRRQCRASWPIQRFVKVWAIQTTCTRSHGALCCCSAPEQTGSSSRAKTGQVQRTAPSATSLMRLKRPLVSTTTSFDSSEAEGLSQVLAQRVRDVLVKQTSDLQTKFIGQFKIHSASVLSGLHFVGIGNGQLCHHKPLTAVAT